MTSRFVYTNAALPAADGFFAAANYVEAALWVLVGLAFSVYAFKHTGLARRLCLGAGVAFLAFGASDVVEVQSGAWWRPWWLLAWKAACIGALAVLLVLYWHRRRKVV